MAQNGPIADHTADGVPSTSTLRDKDAAEAGSEPVVETMSRGAALVGAANSFTFSKTVKTDRPAADFTPRLVPMHPAAMVPLECARVIWYR